MVTGGWMTMEATRETMVPRIASTAINPKTTAATTTPAGLRIVNIPFKKT
jgi:hypothetical protein